MTSLAEAEAHMARLKSKARDAFVAKDWAAARALYTECLEIHPSAALFSNRAACFVELRLYKEALADADLALERDPTFAKAQFRRGRAYEGLNMLGDAVAAYEAGLALEPENAGLRSAAKRVGDLRAWLKDGGGGAPEVAAASLEPAAPPAPQTRLEQDITNKGSRSYYYAAAAQRRTAEAAAAPLAPPPPATVPVASYSWAEKSDAEARVYLPFEPGDLADLDSARDVDVAVDVKNWQNTKLDVVVRLRGETRTLAIPRLYDKVRFSRVIKKKAKLIVCLEKLRRAPWPQLAWDPKRDDEHRDAAERARGTGMR